MSAAGGSPRARQVKEGQKRSVFYRVQVYVVLAAMALLSGCAERAKTPAGESLDRFYTVRRGGFNVALVGVDDLFAVGDFDLAHQRGAEFGEHASGERHQRCAG